MVDGMGLGMGRDQFLLSTVHYTEGPKKPGYNGKFQGPKSEQNKREGRDMSRVRPDQDARVSTRP